MSAKQSIKHQLHTTYVGAVGWEPHSSSTTTCTGKVDRELPVNESKGHTYTNPRLSHYLTHAHSHIMQAVAAMDSSVAHTGTHQHGIAVGQWPRKTLVQRPFPAEASPSSASSTNTCGSCWLENVRQLSHDMQGEGGSWVRCMCSPCFNLSFENSELNCSTA